MFRLNVLYITFWDLSNGIYGFSYKWIWNRHFLKSWWKPYRNITKDPRTWVCPGCGVADFRISLCHPNVYQNLLFNALGAMTILFYHWLLVYKIRSDCPSVWNLHYITLHYITLHYITLHYITLHYIT